MCETWTLAVLTLMTSVGGDLAVGVAAGDERQHLRLARRQAEDLLQALLARRATRVGRREIEPRALGEQLELAQQRLRSDPSRDGVRLPERHARLGAGGAGGDERLGLAPAAVGRERRAFEPLPGRRGLRPQPRAARSPRARSYSASARASQPAAFGVIAEASRGGAARDGRAASVRGRAGRGARRRPGGRVRALPAPPVRAVPWRRAGRGSARPRDGVPEPDRRWTAASASVQRRSHRASSAR